STQTLWRSSSTTPSTRTRACDVSSRRARAVRAAAPLAPRSDVEPGAGEAGAVERKQGMAGGHAGAAVHDGLLRRDAVEHAGEQRAQLAGGLERPVGAQVVGVPRVAPARDLPGDGIERIPVPRQ